MEYDKNGMNFSDLPMKGKYIDWKNSIGKYIYFNKNETTGKLYIINYNKGIISVSFENNISDINCSNLKEGKILNIIHKENKIVTNNDSMIDFRNFNYTWNGIDWKNSIGCTAKFSKKDIKGEFTLVSYLNNGKVKVKYNNKYFTLKTYHLTKGMGLDKLTENKVFDKYRYNIGDVINGLEIKEQVRKNNNNAYKIYCNKCGYNSDEYYYNEKYIIEY